VRILLHTNFYQIRGPVVAEDTTKTLWLIFLGHVVIVVVVVAAAAAAATTVYVRMQERLRRTKIKGDT